MIKYIIAKKSTYGAYDRDSSYLHSNGYVGSTPSKYFFGDCYYAAFYKARWFNSRDDAAKAKSEIGAINAPDFEIIQVKITWHKTNSGNKYPELEIIGAL